MFKHDSARLRLPAGWGGRELVVVGQLTRPLTSVVSVSAAESGPESVIHKLPSSSAVREAALARRAVGGRLPRVTAKRAPPAARGLTAGASIKQGLRQQRPRSVNEADTSWSPSARIRLPLETSSIGVLSLLQ